MEEKKEEEEEEEGGGEFVVIALDFRAASPGAFTSGLPSTAEKRWAEQLGSYSRDLHLSECCVLLKVSLFVR